MHAHTTLLFDMFVLFISIFVFTSMYNWNTMSTINCLKNLCTTPLIGQTLATPIKYVMKNRYARFCQIYTQHIYPIYLIVCLYMSKPCSWETHKITCWIKDDFAGWTHLHGFESHRLKYIHTVIYLTWNLW